MLRMGFPIAAQCAAPEFQDSQTRGMVEEYPRQAELRREVLRKRFHAKRLGCVVAAVEDVYPKLLRHRVSPVWAFASDECVHSLGCREFAMLSCSSNY